MKKPIYAIFAFFILQLSALAQSTSSDIHINQVGYLPTEAKKAWLVKLDPQKHTTWYLKNSSTDEIVKTGSISSKGVFDQPTGETVLGIDFSDIQTKGSYFIEVPNKGRSYDFEISENTMNNVFYHVMRSFYYQRSGMALDSQYAGIWSRPTLFSEDAYLYGGYQNGKIVKGEYRQSVKGWFDAGDYGKKVTAAASSMYHTLKLFEYYPNRVDQVNLNIPKDEEIAALPDALAEVKYELDWFFTMQDPDGGVHHLITTENFHFEMAHTDHQTRYIVPVSSMATGDFAAVMAISSIVYRPYSEAFANKCLQAAELAWTYLENHPDIVPTGGYTADPQGINATGQYLDTDDKDERLWAAAELLNATGKAKYETYFETGINKYQPYSLVYGAGWLDVHNFAIYTYLHTKKGISGNALVDDLRGDLQSYMDLLLERCNSTGFGLALTSTDYYWSSNQLVLNYGVELILGSELLDNPEYRKPALNHLNYVLGSNSLGISYTSGIGEYHVKDILQASSPRDGIDAVIPGFVTGGPNQYPHEHDIPLKNLVAQTSPPPAKCFVDHFGSYSSNEVVLSISGPMTFMTGFFVGDQSIVNSTKSATETVYNAFFFLDGEVLKLKEKFNHITIVDMHGKKVSKGSKVQELNVSKLADGNYIIKADNRTGKFSITK